MGCVLGILASLAAAGTGWLAFRLGAPAWLVLLAGLACYVGFAIPVKRHGHAGFGGAQDLRLYIAVAAVCAVLLIPRLSGPVACRAVERHLAWAWTAEQAYRAAHGTYTAELQALVAAEAARQPSDFDERITLTIASASDSAFVATAEYFKCEGGTPRWIDQAWTPAR